MKRSIPSFGAGFIAPVAGAFIVDIALHGWSAALARLPWFAAGWLLSYLVIRWFVTYRRRRQGQHVR